AIRRAGSPNAAFAELIRPHWLNSSRCPSSARLALPSLLFTFGIGRQMSFALDQFEAQKSKLRVERRFSRRTPPRCQGQTAGPPPVPRSGNPASGSRQQDLRDD